MRCDIVAEGECNFALRYDVRAITVFVEDSYFHFPPLSANARAPLDDKSIMERSTLLAAIWAESDTATDDKTVAENTRIRLESGELEAAGNFRHESASYWAKDEE